MRYLFGAFLLAAMVSPCFAKDDILDSPEMWAANKHAAGERSAARIIASQQAEEAKEREATTRVVAIVIGAIICTAFIAYGLSKRSPLHATDPVKPHLE